MSNALLLTSPLLAKHGFRHGMSTRQGGVSLAPFESLNLAASVGDEPDHVAENQRRFAAAVGYAPEALFTLSQVHGRAVRVLSANDTPEQVRVEQGDALIAPAGVPVAVRTADCVPVLLVDPSTRRVAAVHAGWRGVVAEVVPAAIDALGVPASRLCAAMFPHIRRCCFEVDAPVAQQLSAAGSGSGKVLVALDEIVRAQLLSQGLSAANIDDVPGCTKCEPERFFSYRRDGARSGRHVTAVLG